MIYFVETIPAIRDNLSIALVEGGDLGKIQNWAPSSDVYSNRVSSITNASRQFLQGKACPKIWVWDMAHWIL